MKNRTIIGIICIVLALVVTFAVAPLVNKLAESKVDIVRMKSDVVQGHQISENDVEIVKVGGSAEVRSHLADLGFVVGTPITVLNTINGNVIVSVMDSRVAISREMAQKIYV